MKYSTSSIEKRWDYNDTEHAAFASERINSLYYDCYVASDTDNVSIHRCDTYLYDDNDNDMEMRKRLSFNDHHRRKQC